MVGRRPPAPPPHLPGYRYESVLGSGGFSDVFLYTQELPLRQVAVKVLVLDTRTEAARKQFVAEANLMARLSAHPSIVTIYHADTAADGRPYLVMEYCPRPNLSARYRQAPLGVAEAVRIGIRLAGAVETAHGIGILHRDIKPANVLTTDYGWPALTDFGISVMTTTGTNHGEAVGMSVPWAAPEFFDEVAERGPAGDVYSLGATVYTLLRGASPFEVPGGSASVLELIRRIERNPVQPLERPDVPPSLQSVLVRAMAKQPSARYLTAAAFGRALQRVEQELHLAQTALDLLDTAIARPGEDGEELRTRARMIRTVAVDAAPRPSPDALGEAPAATLAGDAAADPDVTAGRPAPGKRRWPAFVVSAALVLGVLAVVVVGALNSPEAVTEPATTTTQSFDDTTTAPEPAPEPVTGLAASREGDNLTVTWEPPPVVGDWTYVWREQAHPDEVHLLEVPPLVLTEPGSVCVEVAVRNEQGLFSDYESVCG